MKNTAILLKLIFKTEMTYKANFFLNLALVFLAQSTRFFYVDAIFNHQQTFGTWTAKEGILAFILSASILLGLESFIHSIASFCRKVYLGQIDAFLCKPTSLYFLFFLRGARFVSLLICSLVFGFGIFYYSRYTPISFTSFLHFLAILIGFILVLSTNILIFAVGSLSVFWLHRLVPMSYIFNQVFKMNLVPGTVYSKSVFPFLVLFIPTLVSSAILVSVIAFKDYALLVYLGAGCLFLAALFKYLFGMALNHAPSHGG